MASDSLKRTTAVHVVAMPYPGRGHINPMMNLCKSLVSTNDALTVTFIVTEEWLGFIGADARPPNIRLASIPNVVPSELVRASNLPEFLDAVFTKMAAPFEVVLDRLELPASLIIADTFLVWGVPVGIRRNIPVASFWPMSAMVFSVLYHFELLVMNRHFPIDLSEVGEEIVDYIPGVSPTRIRDLPTILYEKEIEDVCRVQRVFSWVPKATCLLLNTMYELEAKAIDELRSQFPLPLYPVCSAPAFPHIRNSLNSPNHLLRDQWLETRPRNSVLYVSFGSFLSISTAQMDEIAAGLCDSGVEFLWIARGECSRYQELCGDKGLVMAWCDQSRVLSHPCVGGFWTHCGWNSTQEGVIAGVPFLTFPITMDQVPNSKVIVEDWKIGWRVGREAGKKEDSMVGREEIAELVKRFMASDENDEVKAMRKGASELGEVTRRAAARGGSLETNINGFLKSIIT